MNKGTITIELPILDDVDQMEVVNTFNEKQLWYVCAIAKAFEKSEQKLQRKDNIINELKQNKRDYERENILEMKLHILNNNWNELKEFIENELNSNVDKEKSFSGYQCKIILDKIKELENDL